ncbi:MAG TPA: Trk system potassium transporter TrkA [Gammaproteobacteria bacterium]|nr:Trk system potassium transporter TrkA [Gammaproteobacteria bacterium]
MKIIILGAGAVGSSIANILSYEDNDITVVDIDAQRLRDLQDRLDIKTVVGMGAHPSVLRQAGAEDADMLIAVTSSDETNMVACQVSYTLFRIPTKIARIRAVDYHMERQLFDRLATPIDVLISPEQILTDHIQRLIEYQGALQVMDFAGGKVQLVAVRALPGAPLVGHRIRTMKQHMPGLRTKIVAVYRKGKAIMPTGDTVIEEGDDIFFLATKKDIRSVLGEMRRLDKPVRRIMLAGGGHIGAQLAKVLEPDYEVKLLERNKSRARSLSDRLSKTIVLLGDVADEELLLEENIDKMDIFCAVTNDDEANILSAMLAKRLGAGKAMCIVNRPAYVDLVEGGDIDVVISPRQVMIGALLAHVRRGDIVAVHSLRRGAAEAIEAVAHGDSRTSKAVGRKVDELDLPAGTTIGAVVRGETVLILEKDVVIEPDDHIVLFVADKKCIPEVEKLFQVDIGFI